jgi:hypothetical protein
MTDSDTYTQAADWLIGTAKRNPEALLVLGAGLALLMRGRGRSNSVSPATPGYSTEQMGGHSPGWSASRAADTISGYAAGVKDRVSEAASAATDRISEAASAATEYAGHAGQTISTGATRWTGQAQSAVQSSASRILDAQPLAVAVFGAAAGAALAALIPVSEVEARTLGSTRETIVDAANQIGENLLGAAGEAGERLKQGAVERGISAEGIKELAHDVADTFTGKVSGRAKPGPQ